MLIVDDDQGIQDALVAIFEAEGYDCAVAGDGETALLLFFRRNPDLVLLDIGLPKLSGVEVCRRIRAADQRVPIIMITAIYDPLWVARCEAVGADDYLTKPFGVSDLLARVEAAMDRRAEAWTQ